MQIAWEEYLDKVYGGWLGKCLGGAAGAPVEGIKELIPCEHYSKLFRSDLPNDDLDLQLLWLEVLEKKGLSITAVDLAEAFERQCWYPFSEYGIFHKNYERGILPPYSGSFNNPLFREGEGCPIRSEIWGMIFPGCPDKAAQYAGMDGSLDHVGEAVWIEQYYASMEAQAFFEPDLFSLLKGQLFRLPKGSRARGCVELVLKEYADWQRSCSKEVRTCPEEGVHSEEERTRLAEEGTRLEEEGTLCGKDGTRECGWQLCRTRLLRSYAHFDFSNAVTNLGIVAVALLYGQGDMDRTVNIAFRCGYDTDCTCATAAALLGITVGAERMDERLKRLVGDRFVTGIDVERKDCTIRTLAQDTCALGVMAAKEENRDVFTGSVPEHLSLSQHKEHPRRIGLQVRYEEYPAIGWLDCCKVTVQIDNPTDREKEGTVHISGLPEGFALVGNDVKKRIEPGETACIPLTFYTTQELKELANTNRIHVDYAGTGTEFGIVGASVWQAAGPYLEALKNEDPQGLPSPHGEGCALPTLECMVNNAACLKKEYIDERDFARAFEQEDTVRVNAYEDLLPLDDIFTFKGQGTVYLRQTLLSPEDREVWAVIGNNDGFRLWVNQEPVMERDEIRLWTPYNNYGLIRLSQGENELVLKLLRRTESLKFSLGLRKYEGEHFHRKRWYVDFAVRP